MKEATKLRNALMKTLCLKADMTNATAGAEDSVNTRIISPICIMDIAYGIWQENVLPVMNPQGEVKACADVIKRIWSTSIYGKKSLFYMNLNDDGIYQLSNYSDELAATIKSDLQYLYFHFLSKFMCIEDTEVRCVFAKLLLIETILSISQQHLRRLCVEYKPLDKLNDKYATLCSIYLASHSEQPAMDFENDKELVGMLQRISDKVLKKVYQ